MNTSSTSKTGNSNPHDSAHLKQQQKLTAGRMVYDNEEEQKDARTSPQGVALKKGGTSLKTPDRIPLCE